MLKKTIKLGIYNFFKFLPIKENIITFESFGGRKFACNPKAIYDEFQKGNYDYKYVIFIKKGIKLEKEYKKDIVYLKSFKWFYYTAVSKYWIKNTTTAGGLPKRKGQIYINTWHSGDILKKQGYDLNNTPPEERTPLKMIRDWDWYVAGSERKAKVFSNSSGYKGKIFVNGMPRIDYLFNFDKQKLSKLKEELGVEDKKVILYAPTYRENDQKGLNNKNILKNIVVPNGYVLLVKFHYYNKKTDVYNEKIKDISDFNDINDLFLIADILISDYSTVIFDYLNLKKPLILYAYDYETYKKVRNFYIDYLKEMPGPIVYSFKELNELLNNLGKIKEKYSGKIEQFYKKYCAYNDGQASSRFVKLFLEGFFEKE